MTINILTMGCSKNLVDSEHLLFQLQANGHHVMHDKNDAAADVVIINTCGFILDAKEESVDTILHYTERKEKGELKKLLVMGCLSERYREELMAELPQVDGFYGVWDWKGILEELESGYHAELLTRRLVTTPSHYAYLKISEGCNRSCAFCSIPGIRGAQQSISVEDLMKEAEGLAEGGVRELILIAQDLTNYGTDLYDRKALPELLKQLVTIPQIEWIRLHYAYPSGFPEEVIRLMASEEKICNYLDIPFQHISDRILHAMNRGHGSRKIRTLIDKFRSEVPDVALRTTMLVGFPGETDDEFNELLQFIRDVRFDRLGVFPYSHEEGTTAYSMDDDQSEVVKMERLEAIMAIQQEISEEINNQKAGKRYKVIIDRREGDHFIGRTQYDSPEVDNEVLLPGNSDLLIGEFYQVVITGSEAFDLYGKVLGSKR